MRRVPVPARVLVPLLCGSLLLTAARGRAENPARRPPPAPPRDTAAAGSSTSVRVMGNRASGEAEIAGYEVWRGRTKVKDVPGGEHMVDITRLEPSTTYVFTVRARGGAGDLGPPGAEVRATAPAAASARRAGPAPGSLDAKVVASTAVRLSWGRSRDDRDVVSYDIPQGDSKHVRAKPPDGARGGFSPERTVATGG